MLRSRPRFLLAAFFAAWGCSPYAQGSLGYSSALTDPGKGRRGVAANAHGGLNLVGDGRVALSVGGHVRGRAAESLGYAGIGPEAMLRYVLHTEQEARSALTRCTDGTSAAGCWRPSPAVRPMDLYLRGGLALVQLGAMEGALSVAAGSPFVEAGMSVSFAGEDVPYWTLSTVLEHDVRITAQPSTPHMSFLLGVGWLKIGDRLLRH